MSWNASRWILVGLGGAGLALVAVALESNAMTVKNNSARPVEVCVPLQRCAVAAAGERVTKTVFLLGRRRLNLRVNTKGASELFECQLPPATSVLDVEVSEDGSVTCLGM